MRLLPPRIAGLVFLLAALLPLAAARPPNLVLIVARDLGAGDAALDGTPNLARLAASGMVFRQAYAGAAGGAPSLACLHSGQYGPRTGIYAEGRTDRGPATRRRLIPVPSRADLPLENITLAEALQAAGYATGLFGKWQLAGDPGTRPSAQGFDVWMDPRLPNPDARRDEPEDPKGIYSMTLAACDFMERNRERPFLAFISHHAVHAPLEARPASLARFQANPAAPGRAGALHAACLHDLDDGVGLLLHRLEELGLAQDTLVLFTADGGAARPASAGPLRGGPGTYREGGLRVPFIASWPGRIPSGSSSDAPVIGLDVYPTFLDAAGVALTEGKFLDGESLLPVLTGQTAALARRALFWHFPGYAAGPARPGVEPAFRTRPVTAVRSGPWKLLLNHEEWVLDGGRARLPGNHAAELYHLGDDPGERHDLATSRPAERDRLLAELLAWLERTGGRVADERNPRYRAPTSGSLKSAPPAP